MKMNQYLDATYLKTARQAEISEEENNQKIITLLNEAILYDYKLVMIRDKYISLAKEMLSNAKSKTLIGTVIGFYEGTFSITEKIAEAKNAIALGADELDFVINYVAFKKGNIALVKEEVLKGTKLCVDNSKVVKWIIETAALNTLEIIEITKLIRNVVLNNFNKDHFSKVYVKTSTGFYKTENNLPNGATLANVKLIVKNAKPLKIKASGGVRDYEMAKKMITLGVDRIGTSSSKEIINKEGSLGEFY